MSQVMTFEPGDEIYIEVPKTGGSDVVIVVNDEGGDELTVLLWNERRSIPRAWVFDGREDDDKRNIDGDADN